MRVSIHQPAYLPWLGYIDKLRNTDIFVVLDTVSFSKNSFDNRNRIVVNQKDHWLTIPINTSGNFGQTYQFAKPATYEWIKNHRQTIHFAYSKTPYYLENQHYIGEMYEQFQTSHESMQLYGSQLLLPDITKIELDFIQKIYRFNTMIVMASQLAIEGEKGSDLVLAICKKLGATEYYSGIMGKDYLNELKFSENKINVVYQSYKPPNYYSFVHNIFVNGRFL